MANNFFRKAKQGFAGEGWDWDLNKWKVYLIDMNQAGPVAGAWVISAITNVANPTLTTTAAHGLSVGDRISINGVAGATGVNNTEDNPWWEVATTPSTTTFTLRDRAGASPAAPGAYTSGGFLSNLSRQNLSDFAPVVAARVAVTAELTSKTFTDGILRAANTMFPSVPDASPISEALLLVRTANADADADVADTSQRLCHYADSGTGFPIDPIGNNINLNFDPTYGIGEI